MPEYLAPGVYVEEVPSGIAPIDGVPTNIAGFVGQADRGPVAPRPVTSWEEFQEIYGDPVERSFLASAVAGFFANGGERCHVARVVGDGSDRPLEPDHFIGDPSLPIDQRTGLAALECIDSISILVAPDEVRQSPVDLTPVTLEAIRQCERRRDRFCIVSAPQGRRDPASLSALPESDLAALYHPWLRVVDPATGVPVLVPPGGHVAGVFARTDRERGIHKAPANEEVRGVEDLELRLTDGELNALAALNVNSIRDFRPQGRGIRLWGARTLSSDPDWKYVSVRRLTLFIEESIDQGTRWVVFEPNAEPLWDRVRRTVADFLVRLWREGALLGTTPQQAFFVRCDRTTMTQDDIDDGRLICVVGIAPLRPAEFVILRIQKTIR